MESGRVTGPIREETGSSEINVAFLIYRRPALTAQVFAEIAKVRPRRLLVVADGPRDAAEERDCLAARRVIEGVNWPCDVLTNFADLNMGCKRRVSSGLDWVFQQVEEAVILEDDCLPHPSFFPYCAELLDRYRTNERVGHIGGVRMDRGPACGASYRFSRYAAIWGWATWRRAWRHYDVAMKDWGSVKATGAYRAWFGTAAEADFFEAYWDDVTAGRIDTWDAQWVYALMRAGLLASMPEVNLVSNIGFGLQGSHARKENHRHANVAVNDAGFPLRHPDTCLVDPAADARFARAVFAIDRPWWQRLWWRITNRHWYGSLLRKVPVAGTVWKQWREKGKGRQR